MSKKLNDGQNLKKSARLEKKKKLWWLNRWNSLIDRRHKAMQLSLRQAKVEPRAEAIWQSSQKKCKQNQVACKEEQLQITSPLAQDKSSTTECLDQLIECPDQQVKTREKSRSIQAANQLRSNRNLIWKVWLVTSSQLVLDQSQNNDFLHRREVSNRRILFLHSQNLLNKCKARKLSLSLMILMLQMQHSSLS